MGRKVGKQADMMPADISMTVQPTVGASVYVGSVLVYVNSTLVRYADANTTLELPVRGGKKKIENMEKWNDKGRAKGKVALVGRRSPLADSQEAQAKRQGKAHLFRFSQLELPDLWKGQKQNDEVR